MALNIARPGLVPNKHRKTDLVDIGILQALYDAVYNYGQPLTIMLISSDDAFAAPLSDLKDFGFSILLADKLRHNDKIYCGESTPLRKSSVPVGHHGKKIRYTNDTA